MELGKTRKVKKIVWKQTLDYKKYFFLHYVKT